MSYCWEGQFNNQGIQTMVIIFKNSSNNARRNSMLVTIRFEGLKIQRVPGFYSWTSWRPNIYPQQNETCAVEVRQWEVPQNQQHTLLHRLLTPEKGVHVSLFGRHCGRSEFSSLSRNHSSSITSFTKEESSVLEFRLNRSTNFCLPFLSLSKHLCKKCRIK